MFPSMFPGIGTPNMWNRFRNSPMAAQARIVFDLANAARFGGVESAGAPVLTLEQARQRLRSVDAPVLTLAEAREHLRGR